MAGRIGIDPKPPTVGESVTLKAGANMKLKVDYDPNGVFEVVTDANGEAVITIPAGASSMIVSDPGNVWTPSSTTINP